MTKTEARQGIQKLNTELLSLQPTAVITMFEIDASDIAADLGISPARPTIFRFHNTVSLFNSTIYWKGEKYVAAPIKAEGFDLNAKGTIATPMLSMTTTDDGVTALSELKQILRELGDLVGAKVTRRRTLAKYLDDVNFEIAPAGFGQDWTVEFPNDIFYISRKSNENKFVIEYELASILDVEGVQIPYRLVSNQRCMWHYRGAGCLYEYKSRYNAETHENCGADALKINAPAVATTLDVPITGMINHTVIIDRGSFNYNTSYSVGDQVFITKNHLNYYYVARTTVIGISPPNALYWVEDQCSRLVNGCKIRHITNTNKFLPFGGFPTVGKYA